MNAAEELPLAYRERSVAPDTLSCQIDHAAGNAHGIFGFGWALDREGAIVRGTLRLRFPNGSSDAVQLSMGRAREDVARAFADCPQAAHAGFMFMAGWSEQPPERAELIFEREDGRIQSMALPLPVGAASPGPMRPLPRHRRWIGWALARIGRGRAGQSLREPLQPARADSPSNHFDAVALAASLKGHRCRLLIDHSMGGGANLFRGRLVSRWLAAGDTVLLLSFRVDSMTAFIEVRSRDGATEYSLDRWEPLIDMVASTDLVEIFFNCAVSFPRALQVQQLLLDVKRRSGAPLVIAMHEYFLVCPSAFLLDRAGKYCGVPAISRCDSCLRTHDDPFVSLAGERSIRRWRGMWGEVLEVAEEIRCFSESTRSLLERAYAGVGGRATLCPHEVEPLRAVHTRLTGRSALTIGVIGFISHHKGAGVVADLANTISGSGANLRIVVVGSIDAPCSSDVVLQTGPYRREELPDLIEKHEIDIALLPSICPETFSFVAHEVASMRLPLLCFDIGAQADFVRQLAAGRVSLRQDGPGLLDEILAFDRDLRSRR